MSVGSMGKRLGRLERLMAGEKIFTTDQSATETLLDFLGLLRECVEAVEQGKVAEIDLEREMEGSETVRITIRREPFSAS